LIPDMPPARGYETTGRAELFPRYEDIAQDGRVVLTSLMPGLGASVWRSLMSARSSLTRFRDQGILPILRRVVIVGEKGPFSVHAPFSFEGTWRLVRDADAAPGEGRIGLLMWMEAVAPTGDTLGPAPKQDAPRLPVGRIFAEHVVTRPFAAAEERKVTRLAGVGGGFPEVPEDTWTFESAEALLADRTLEDRGEHAFTMMHTDGNQHVNSLVYPRVFEERVAATPPRLARAIDVRWRKPFFAGDRARITIDARSDDVAGAFIPLDATKPATKPSCAIRMRFE
jgi:hypothetical protein